MLRGINDEIEVESLSHALQQGCIMGSWKLHSYNSLPPAYCEMHASLMEGMCVWVGMGALTSFSSTEVSA